MRVWAGVSAAFYAVAMACALGGCESTRREVANIVVTQARAQVAITTAELVSLRDIDALVLSPDERRYAVRVRRADPVSDRYRTAWYIGDTEGGAPTFAADGGDAEMLMMTFGPSGDIAGGHAVWSPDSTRLAFAAYNRGQRQIWVVAPGRNGRQVTHNQSDVRAFAWSTDGREILFAAGPTRDEVADVQQEAQRNGANLDDFTIFADMVSGGLSSRARDALNSVPPGKWIVDADGNGERPALESDEIQFQNSGPRVEIGPTPLWNAQTVDGVRGRVVNEAGDAAWFAQAPNAGAGFRLSAQRAHAEAEIVTCIAAPCEGRLFASDPMWSNNDHEIFFWSSFERLGPPRLWTWSPETNAIRTVLSGASPGAQFYPCAAAAEFLLCVYQSDTHPPGLVRVLAQTGTVVTQFEPNASISADRLGRVEWLEWELHADLVRRGFPARAHGRIIFPPAFDPARQYPVIIAPYVARGFPRGDTGNEQPLFVYAANGFIVLDSAFPLPMAPLDSQAPDGRFAFHRMSMESTFRALDLLVARGFVDETRIGMGGLSHAASTSLFALHYADRLSAVSVSNPGWSRDFSFYGRTGYFENMTARVGAPSGYFPEDDAYWDRLDLAEHVDQVEAPILFQVPDREVYGIQRLQWRLRAARLPYDAYVFLNEHHQKFRPSNHLAIYNRNLDWFRFWLQDVEDSDPSKADQYQRWRRLRDLQCRNQRSLRDYCNVQSTIAPVSN